jgi:hypothetical protein
LSNDRGSQQIDSHNKRNKVLTPFAARSIHALCLPRTP